MGQLAFIEMFLLVSIPTDINDNRRHVHVFKKGNRHMKSVAKIWIESGGQKCIEIAYSGLTAKENEMLMSAISSHWEFINEQIEEIVLDKNKEIQMSKNSLKVSTNNVEDKIYKEILK